MTALRERDLAEEADARWHSVVRDPAPPLRAHVTQYQGYVERSDGATTDRQLPSGNVVLILGFGSPMRIDYRGAPGSSVVSARAFVAGLHDTHVVTESDGAGAGVQVNLSPIGARMLFGQPMHTLANRAIALEDVLGADGRALPEQLHETPNWGARFDLVDEAICARVAAATPPSEGVAWAWSRLQATHGRASIGRLSGELGYSRKRMVAEFRDHIGLSPKTAARILRFSRAIRLLGAARTPSWPRIALACGYYDQAHFNRDFRQFSGMTPTEYMRGARSDQNVTYAAA